MGQGDGNPGHHTFRGTKNLFGQIFIWHCAKNHLSYELKMKICQMKIWNYIYLLYILFKATSLIKLESHKFPLDCLISSHRLKVHHYNFCYDYGRKSKSQQSHHKVWEALWIGLISRKRREQRGNCICLTLDVF